MLLTIKGLYVNLVLLSDLVDVKGLSFVRNTGNKNNYK
jgi:hypothetical protein